MRRGQKPKRHRVAILGTGVMGRRHVRVFSELAERFEVVGVFDTNAAVGHEVAKSWGVTCFVREEEALRASDLVVISSPIAAHAAQVRRALEAGSSVLVEKPICARAADAELLASTPERGQHLFVGHSERYNPVIIALRELVVPGEVLGLALRRVAPPGAHSREHSVVLSLGVHDVDLAAHLAGGPVHLHSASGVGDDRADLVVTCAAGAVARIWADRTSRLRERRIELTTGEHHYAGDLLGSRLVCSFRSSGVAREVPLCNVEPLVAQAGAVADVLDGRPSSDIARGVDGARALAVAEQATVWIRDGARERVPAAS